MMKNRAEAIALHGQKDIAKISNHDEDRITSMMDGRDDMAVEYRRLGIARILLDKVVKEARDYGCGTVQITASDMGVLLYTDYGFRKNGNFMYYTFSGCRRKESGGLTERRIEWKRADCFCSTWTAHCFAVTKG